MHAAWDNAAAWVLYTISATFAVIAVSAPALVRSFLADRREEIEAKRETRRALRAQRVENASDRAVAATEQIAQTRGLRGQEKLSLASEIAAKIAPDAPPAPELLEAAVAKLRSSTSSTQLRPVTLPTGARFSIPVQVISDAPPPLPPPAPVPRMVWPDDEGKTR